jgi:hypothetical protein
MKQCVNSLAGKTVKSALTFSNKLDNKYQVNIKEI